MCYCSDKKVFFCKSNDNSIVNIGSNLLTDEPVQSVERRVKRKSDVNVAQPFLVEEYNSGIAGLDVMDWFVESYHPTIRGRIWY